MENIVMLPGRYEHVLVTRSGEIHAWGDDLTRLLWHRRPPTNDDDCYALLWDYTAREVHILEWQEGGVWRFDQRSTFKGVEKEVFAGVPPERTLVPAAPACVICRHRDVLLVDSVCARCLARHTSACVERRRIQIRGLALYQRYWPMACLHCHEEGQHVWSSNSYYVPDDCEPCDQCTGRFRCARCGRYSLAEDGEGPCHWCGWDYGESLMPSITFVCICSSHSW